MPAAPVSPRQRARCRTPPSPHRPWDSESGNALIDKSLDDCIVPCIDHISGTIRVRGCFLSYDDRSGFHREVGSVEETAILSWLQPDPTQPAPGFPPTPRGYDAVVGSARHSARRVRARGARRYRRRRSPSAYGLHYFSRDLPDFQQIANYVPAIGSKVYDADGKLIAEFETERRIPVSIDEVPTLVDQRLPRRRGPRLLHP